MRTRSVRMYARRGADGATGTVATLTERYYRGFARNVAGLARGSHSSRVNVGCAPLTHVLDCAPGRGKIVRWPILTYAPVANRTSMAPTASAGWRWRTPAARDGQRTSPLVM